MGSLAGVERGWGGPETEVVALSCPLTAPASNSLLAAAKRAFNRSWTVSRVLVGPSCSSPSDGMGSRCAAPAIERDRGRVVALVIGTVVVCSVLGDLATDMLRLCSSSLARSRCRICCCWTKSAPGDGDVSARVMPDGDGASVAPRLGSVGTVWAMSFSLARRDLVRAMISRADDEVDTTSPGTEAVVGESDIRASRLGVVGFASTSLAAALRIERPPDGMRGFNEDVDSLSRDVCGGVVRDKNDLGGEVDLSLLL